MGGEQMTQQGLNQRLDLNTHLCCVSIQGVHPSKDPDFAVFEGESFGETLLISTAVVK